MSELRVYAEIGEDQGCLLFTYEPPGLLVRANSMVEAMELAPKAAQGLANFLTQCGSPYPNAGPSPDIIVTETKRRRGKVANGNTSITFEMDKVPVDAEEVPRFLIVLAHQRREFMELRDLIPEGGYDYKSLPHRKTILEQLIHVAGCDRWYLSRLWSDLPRLPRSQDVWNKLELNRERVIDKLLALTPEDRAMVVRTEGEVWTCRKFMRRLMYHERFHLDTIRRDLDLYLSTLT